MSDSSSRRRRLQSKNLSKRFGGTEVLRDVNLDLQPGWTAIVGPNGAGKSTLLKCLASILTPDSGQVLLDGQDLSTMSARQRGQALAWMAQQSSPEIGMEAIEVVRLGRLPHMGLFGSPGQQDRAAVGEAMQLTGSSAWASRSIADLSGGERQRTLLARTLAVQAGVMLLDEPTTHLDPEHQVALARLMKQLGRADTVVSVLHDLNLALLADRLVVMTKGRVVVTGSTDDPLVHRHLVEVFAGAVVIRRVGRQWLAVPEFTTDD